MKQTIREISNWKLCSSISNEIKNSEITWCAHSFRNIEIKILHTLSLRRCIYDVNRFRAAAKIVNYPRLVFHRCKRDKRADGEEKKKKKRKERKLWQLVEYLTEAEEAWSGCKLKIARETWNGASSSRWAFRPVKYENCIN